MSSGWDDVNGEVQPNFPNGTVNNYYYCNKKEVEKGNVVGTLFGIESLCAMTVYKDEYGLFVTKTYEGMCGTEFKNIYFKNDKIVIIGGHTYRLYLDQPSSCTSKLCKLIFEQTAFLSNFIYKRGWNYFR